MLPSTALSADAHDLPPAHALHSPPPQRSFVTSNLPPIPPRTIFLTTVFAYLLVSSVAAPPIARQVQKSSSLRSEPYTTIALYATRFHTPPCHHLPFHPLLSLSPHNTSSLTAAPHLVTIGYMVSPSSLRSTPMNPLTSALRGANSFVLPPSLVSSTFKPASFMLLSSPLFPALLRRPQRPFGGSYCTSICSSSPLPPPANATPHPSKPPSTTDSRRYLLGILHSCLILPCKSNASA